VILFFRHHYRKRRAILSDDNPNITYLPSSPLVVSQQHIQPARIYQAKQSRLRSWHDSVIWGTNTHRSGPISLRTSEAFAVPSELHDKAKGMFSNDTAATNERLGYVKPEVQRSGEINSELERDQRFLASPGLTALKPTPTKVTDRNKMGWTGIVLDETNGNEDALERELTRQGFGTEKRPMVEPPAVALTQLRDSMAVSEMSDEPARWRSALSWARDQGERLNLGRNRDHRISD
jgi:hypothetical protein